MATRRTFLKLGSAGAAGLYLTTKFSGVSRLHAQVSGGTLPPGDIPKFVRPLVIPPAMPIAQAGALADYYEIAVRQFDQQILPAPLPPTTVWSYGSVARPETFHYPAFTIEATANRPVRATWMNGLVDRRGRYLPHLLPVDQTLHWANPPGGVAGRDGRGVESKAYTGPVPMVAHLHGGHTADDSDGFPEAWYLPAAVDIPAGHATEGTWYSFFRNKFAQRSGVEWAPGTATFEYTNDQNATTLWYHDHTLGMTRLNVYAGPAGFYLLRGGPGDLPPGALPGPAPAAGDAAGTSYYEIPIAIQDRSFNANGSLFYPDNRAFFEGLKTGHLQIPFMPEAACAGSSDVPPIWNPEFFGNTIVVNGAAWPFLDVEQRRYRFRFLNGCNSRFLILRHDRAGLGFWQAGGDGGFLPTPVPLDRLLLAPAERADVIVDFTNVPVGSEVTLLNLGPDEPFGGGVPGVDFEPSDPASTGLVMQFRVRAAESIDVSTPPQDLALPARAPLPPAGSTRRLSLNESESATVRVVEHRKAIRLACDDPEAFAFGPTAALLGTVGGEDEPMPMMWMDAVTENPAQGQTEVWEIHNHTEDAHPIHVHQVMFEVVGRASMTTGDERAAESWEAGPKDTVVAYPGEITRIKATFDLAGLYVWHCHILEHEDNEMMRPYEVTPAT